MKMAQTQYSETSAFKLQKRDNPEESRRIILFTDRHTFLKRNVVFNMVCWKWNEQEKRERFMNRRALNGHDNRGHFVTGRVLNGHDNRGHFVTGRVLNGHENRGHFVTGRVLNGHDNRGHFVTGRALN
jgi:ribosomal protein L35AE/L33A